MSKIHNELNEKVSEIKHLHFELTRRENEESGEAVDSLKRQIQTLERENAALKVGRFMHYLFNCILKNLDYLITQKFIMMLLYYFA